MTFHLFGISFVWHFICLAFHLCVHFILFGISFVCHFILFGISFVWNFICLAFHGISFPQFLIMSVLRYGNHIKWVRLRPLTQLFLLFSNWVENNCGLTSKGLSSDSCSNRHAWWLITPTTSSSRCFMFVNTYISFTFSFFPYLSAFKNDTAYWNRWTWEPR